jgi:hypothetical protein
LRYSTWFAEGFFRVRDPDVAHAPARAYDDWLANFGKAAPNRLFAAAVSPMQNMDLLSRKIAAGAAIPSCRAVFIRPMLRLSFAALAADRSRLRRGKARIAGSPALCRNQPDREG